MSLYTALVGAAVNVALNLILIPQWGAMGASVATFVSYFIVYIIRAVTMKRFLPFNVYHGKLIVNTVLLGAIVCFMTCYGYNKEIWMLCAAAGFLLVGVAYNARDVYSACRQVLSSLKGKKQA